VNHLGLFEGIGGFSLAAHWMGWKTLAWCEWNEFGQKVLRHHFPEAEGFGDITKTDFTKYANKIDILTGGFPCQPYSSTGKRKGKEDDRHLWPEMLRVIREVRPTWVVGENVPGILSWSRGMVVNEIKTDLENEGFTLLPPFIIPACAVNADHRRDRVWFVAHSNGKRLQGEQQRELQHISSTVEKPTQTLATHEVGKKLTNFLPEPKTIGRNDGIPVELDGITFSKWREESIKGYGNAIVPQIAFEIFKAIEATDKQFPPTFAPLAP
jgi:DNA (cytosine-5)-methyltransferase 1